MTLKRFLFALIAAISVPAYAKPIETDVELGAMFVPGGLTADQSAARARVASPAVWRKVAEVESAIASVDAAQLARIPRVTSKLTYTRLSLPTRLAVVPLHDWAVESMFDRLEHALENSTVPAMTTRPLGFVARRIMAVLQRSRSLGSLLPA